MKIFVSVASYCDPMLNFTVGSAIRNAKHPENLHFGVVDQSPADQPRLKLEDGSLAKLSYIRILPQDTRGVCWARSMVMTLYANEEWFFQIDSHTHFDQDWDEILINWAVKLSEERRKIVISSYPIPFIMENGTPTYTPFDGVLVHAIKETTVFSEDDLRLGAEARLITIDTVVPSFFIAAGCLFASGKIVYEVPYDPFFYFNGEEQAFALRLFTKGWDMFHIPQLPVYHMYRAAEEKSRPIHWDEDQDEARNTRWYELEAVAKDRFKDLIKGKPMGMYGLGDYRTVEDYAAYSGIDYVNKTIGGPAHTGKLYDLNKEAERNGEEL